MMLAAMQYRQFGNTEITVSELGLGCSGLGGGLFRHDQAESAHVVHEAIDRGVNFFDTADNYSLGESERILGRAFRGRRDKIVIATKVGARFGTADVLLMKARPLMRPFKSLLGNARRSINLVRDKRKHYDFSPAHMTQALEGSLRRFGTDYLDIYQLYNPSIEQLENFEAGEVLERFKAAGKIRHYGITSNHAAEALVALKRTSVQSVQLPVSLLDQEALPELLALAATKGVAVIASTPLGQGLLTDAQGTTKADESSHFTVEEITDRRRRATDCRRLCRPDRTLAQAALRYVLQLPAVSVAVPSAMTRAELRENLGALGAPALSSTEMGALHARA